jgi:hypothetical protein
MELFQKQKTSRRLASFFTVCRPRADAVIE